jgi:hypothetical protein
VAGARGCDATCSKLYPRHAPCTDVPIQRYS